jgi:hypothetical protein
MKFPIHVAEQRACFLRDPQPGEAPMSTKSEPIRREDQIPESSNNVLIPVTERLYQASQRLGQQDWDPHAPALTLQQALNAARRASQG